MEVPLLRMRTKLNIYTRKKDHWHRLNIHTDCSVRNFLVAPHFPLRRPRNYYADSFEVLLWSGSYSNKFSSFCQTSFRGNGQTQDGLIQFGYKYAELCDV